MSERQRADWRRLLDLLSPIHDDARAFARRLARSVSDGDDLFQEALLRAHEKLGGLREESSFRPWFYAVLLSVHRSRCRRDFWRRFLSLEDVRERGEVPAAEDPRLSEEEARARRVSRALASLPAVQREAVVLFELEDFTIEEVAGLQKVSVSTAKSRVARGRARLRRFYERLGFGRCGAGPVRRKRKGAPRGAGWDATGALVLRAGESLPPLERNDG